MEAGKPGIGIISLLAFQGLRWEKPPGTTGEQDMPGLLPLTPPGDSLHGVCFSTSVVEQRREEGCFSFLQPLQMGFQGKQNNWLRQMQELKGIPLQVDVPP